VIIAEKKNYSYQHDYQPKIKVKKGRKIKVRLLLSVFVVFVLGLSVLFRYVYIVESKYQLENMKRELSRIDKENKLLKVKLAELKSLDRIEKIAKSKLGMIEPGVNNFVFIRVPEYSVTSEQGRNTGNIDKGLNKPEDKSNSSGILSGLIKIKTLFD